MAAEVRSELELRLPSDLPHREAVIEGAARHLELIEATNRQFNLTRITSPSDAVIKHVLDSVLPWRLFREARHVLDAGSGAGFPGIPLSLALPQVRFTLAESVQKKARFIQSAVEALGLRNVEVLPVRAEDYLKSASPDILTARAVAPVERAVALFGAAMRKGTRLLLYKGPDADAEIGDAARELIKARARASVAMRYELPEGLGSRTVVEVTSSAPGAAAGSR